MEEQEWAPGDEPDSYETSLASARLRIRSRDADEEVPYIFEFITPSDDVGWDIETEPRVTDESAEARTVRVAHNMKIKRLYQLARRALGLDVLLTDVEKALGID